jgi:hypothetical protein
VIRIVLAGGGAIASLLELLEELEPGEPQGSIATVCVSVLLGITSRLEPGGMVVLPDSVVCAASEHEVTAIVSGVCCLGITTVRTPGLISAVVTGSMELDDPPPLLPHADRTAAAAAHVINAATRRFLGAWIVILLLRSRS